MPPPKPRSWSVSPTPTTRIVAGLFRSRNYVWDGDHHVVESFGLTRLQFLILRALRFKTDDFTLAPTDLYAATQSSSSGTAKMLGILAEKGLVTRIPNPTDGRSTLVQLTDAGADLTEQIVDQLIETNTDLFSGVMSEDELQTLADLLHKLSHELERKKSSGT